MRSMLRSPLRLLVIAALVACTPAPTPIATACLTRDDCGPGEICVGGRCVTDTTRDAGVEQDAFAFEDAITFEDAFAFEDAFVDGTDDASAGSGENCEDRIVLTLDGAGHAHAEGNFGDFERDFTVCGDGPDVVYELVVGSGAHDIEASAAGEMGTDPMMAFAPSCTDSPFLCANDRAAGDPRPRLLLHRYPDERVFFFVSGRGAADLGHFTFDVAVSAPADTSTCATALDLTGGAVVVAWGTTTDAVPHPSCSGMGSAESDVYSVSSAGDTTIDRIVGYFGTEGGIALVDSCAPAHLEAWCAAATSSEMTGYTLDTSALPFTIGTGYLVVSQPAPAGQYVFAFGP